MDLMSDDGSLRRANILSARTDFHKARQKAAISNLWAFITGKSIDLLPYDEVARKLKVAGGVDRGLKEIPISSIVGSVSRQTDFTRGFLPRSDRDEVRWARVKASITDMDLGGFDPIQVYQIGDAYFVSDGHHRISIAKQLGAEFIQAYVIEILTKVPLSPDIQPSELIIKAEYADFLQQTRLDELRPGSKIEFTVPGLYTKLLNHIEVHRYYMGIDLKREISDSEAIIHWYDKIYLPIINIIRSRNLLHEFPGRSEADLYIWVSEHNDYMQKELGWKIRPETAAKSLSEQFSPKVEKIISRVRRNIQSKLIPDELEAGPQPGEWRKERTDLQGDHSVFTDILVPLSGSKASWNALDEAILLARQEGSYILGLTITKSNEKPSSPHSMAILDEFNQRCKIAGVPGALAFDHGKIAQTITNRSSFADIIVLNLSHPPSSHPLARYSSGFRTILRLSPRPVLAVPGKAGPICNFLLAYDESPKADEALYLTTYLAGKCNSEVTIVTVMDNQERASAISQKAKQYLDDHSIPSVSMTPNGEVATVILEIARDQRASMIVMGSYGSNPVMEMFIGSTLDGILKNTSVPVLICR